MPYHLRLGGQADIATIRRLDEMPSQKFRDIPDLADLATSATEEGGVNESTVKDWLSKGEVYIAESNETAAPVGFVAFHQLTNTPDALSTLYIAELGVVPNHQGKGLGARLVRAVMDPENEGFERTAPRRVVLMTFADVPWNKPWYLSKFGFREVAEGDVAGEVGSDMAEIFAEDKAKLERPKWRRCCLLWERQST